MRPNDIYAALALAALAACSPEPASETTSAPVRRGTLTTEAPWSVRINFPWGKYCSGSVLTEHLILTAAHCMKDHEAFGEVTVLWADRLGGSDRLYEGRARFYPNANYGGRFHTANDIGLVKIDGGAIDLAKTGRAKLWGGLTRPWASADVGDRIFFALGWGDTGDDCENKPGVKFISGQSLLDRADFDDTTVTTPTGLPAVCPGDSGSAWLFRRDGELIAFAVTSRYIPWPFEWDEAPLIGPLEGWIYDTSHNDGLDLLCTTAGRAGNDVFKECREQPARRPPPPPPGTGCPGGGLCCDPDPAGGACRMCVARNQECP